MTPRQLPPSQTQRLGWGLFVVCVGYPRNMARQLILHMTDDFTGEPADEECILGWEGYDYSIDLTSDHYKELHELLQPYLEAAHERNKQRKRPAQKMRAAKVDPGTVKPNKEERDRIRAWARDNGHNVGDKGVIAQAIVDAYREANQ
ncbi:Lsr2-like DNA bridging protein [Gordonia phage Switzerland]|nr:Lsr2-like DNA bridging protein [Gordonia phage Switzerland]